METVFFIHNLSPIAFEVGNFSIKWYGIMYFISFILAFKLAKFQFRYYKANENFALPQDRDDFLNNLFTYSILGVIIGGRVGNVLIYNLPLFLEQPLFLFKIWKGGMSFHGGLIGVVLASWLFIRRYYVHFLDITDLFSSLAPIGLFFGRIGNFINGELYGRASEVSWAVIFPAGGNIPRHPSQLYEAVFEGVILFLITQVVLRKNPTRGALTACFLIGYGIFRFIIEFFREIDYNINTQEDWLTIGQILCFIMIVLGLAITFYQKNKKIVKS